MNTLGYARSTKKIYYSIFFILPFLAVYEAGLFLGVLGNNINGADAILRFFFYILYGVLGVQLTRILSAILIFALIAYLVYYLMKNRVRIRMRYFFLMFFESLLWAFFVGIIIHLSLSRTFPRFFSLEPNQAVVGQLAITGLHDFWAKIVASIGAGIFEELVFRVILIRIFYQFWKSGHVLNFGPDTGALVKAVGLSSVIFTLMHLGSVASFYSLIPVFLGSLVLSFIYVQRGYGIVAATHIFYDVYLMFGILA